MLFAPVWQQLPFKWRHKATGLETTACDYYSVSVSSDVFYHVKNFLFTFIRFRFVRSFWTAFLWSGTNVQCSVSQWTRSFCLSLPPAYWSVLTPPLPRKVLVHVWSLELCANSSRSAARWACGGHIWHTKGVAHPTCLMNKARRLNLREETMKRENIMGGKIRRR